MRADKAVEPTKSENITVTWRRSAVSAFADNMFTAGLNYKFGGWWGY
jgi:hypothetical protein